MRPVFVDFDPSLSVLLGIAIATDVVTLLDEQDALAQIVFDPFCNRSAEKNRPDDANIVIVEVHNTSPQPCRADISTTPDARKRRRAGL
jgi:hypothetical protein